MQGNKHWYICPLEVVLAHQSENFKESHWIKINDTEVLLVAKFIHEGMELRWRNFHPSIKKLPHLLSGRPIDPEHVNKLAHLGVKHGHNTFDMAEAVAQYAPLHGADCF